jgi:glycosyltransferase involved in cell wall biosynthesis
VQFDNLARLLSAFGHRVTVVSRASRGAPEYERSVGGYEVWRVGMPLWRKRIMGRTLDRILHARSVASKVRRLDDQLAFDVIEAPEAGLDAERLAKDPRFVDRLVVSCHGSNRRGQSVAGPLAPLHWLDWWWSLRREGALLSRVQTIVANSRATKEEILRHGVHLDGIDVVHLGINPDRFCPGVGSNRETLHVGFVGRLQEDKGIDFVWRVVEQMSSDRRIRFHLKGAMHPASRAETLRRLDEFRDRVQYHPPDRYEEMPDFFRSLDVLLLPSRFESFGLVYIEAMATELVVFAGRGGAGPEVISDGETGFLVDPDGRVDAVVNQLLSLASDRSLLRPMRIRAREAVLRRFTARRSALNKLAVYQRMSGKGHA